MSNQDRIDELERFSDWLTDNDPADFLAYVHARLALLESSADLSTGT